MIIIGAILVIALSLLLSLMFGQFGIILIAALTVGLIFSIYIKIHKLMEDSQLIKDKLGMTQNDENANYQMSDEAIEKELENELEKELENELENEFEYKELNENEADDELEVHNPKAPNLVVEEWSAPGTPDGAMAEWIAPLHVHYQDDEAWYVLEGVMGFRSGDEVIEIRAGGRIVIPAGTPHTYWNPSPVEARYVIIMTARIRALIDAIHSAKQRDSITLKTLFRQYDSELLE